MDTAIEGQAGDGGAYLYRHRCMDRGAAERAACPLVGSPRGVEVVLQAGGVERVATRREEARAQRRQADRALLLRVRSNHRKLRLKPLGGVRHRRQQDGCRARCVGLKELS